MTVTGSSAPARVSGDRTLVHLLVGPALFAALVLLGGLPMDFAIATSLLVIAMKSFAGFAGFIGHTPIDWSLALSVSSAAVLGSVAGSGLSGRLHPRALQRGFGWFVLAMAVFMLAQELPLLLGGASNLPLSLLASFVGTGFFAVVRALVGHGIGRQMHEEPQVPNYGLPGRGPKLMAGQVLAIEPMVNAGGAEVVTRDDGWTVATRDGGLSAHFEHTVAVGGEGPVVLSESEE